MIILLIDYGYLKPYNQSTLQSVIKHRKNNPNQRFRKGLFVSRRQDFKGSSEITK